MQSPFELFRAIRNHLCFCDTGLTHPFLHWGLCQASHTSLGSNSRVLYRFKSGSWDFFLINLFILNPPQFQKPCACCSYTCCVMYLGPKLLFHSLLIPIHRSLTLTCDTLRPCWHLGEAQRKLKTRSHLICKETLRPVDDFVFCGLHLARYWVLIQADFTQMLRCSPYCAAGLSNF